MKLLFCPGCRALIDLPVSVSVRTFALLSAAQPQTGHRALFRLTGHRALFRLTGPLKVIRLTGHRGAIRLIFRTVECSETFLQGKQKQVGAK